MKLRIAAPVAAALLFFAGFAPRPNALSAREKTEYPLPGGSAVLEWGPAEPAENTNTGWWKGAFGTVSLPAGECGVKYEYDRRHDCADNAVQIERADGVWGSFYPFGSPAEFADGWQTCGKAEYFVNGEPTSPALQTGDKAPAEEGFWHGSFTISVFRCTNNLYTVCDFLRSGGQYRLTAVYSFGSFEGPFTVRMSGYCADLQGTVSRAVSVCFVADDCQTRGHLWGEWTLGADGAEERFCTRCSERETRESERVVLFRAGVEKVKNAQMWEEKLSAIGEALSLYEKLQEGERTLVAKEYAALEEEIAAYNRAAEAVNEAFLGRRAG